MCLKQPLNTDICPSQIDGLLCHGASQFCLKASCIIEGINAEGVYLEAKILPCCHSAIVCGSSELNFTASGCYDVNVSSTVGVCFSSDGNQQQESKTNGTFDLTVTSVINLARTYTCSRLSTSATTGFGGTTPTASSSSQTHSLSPTFIIIGVLASVIALLIVILTTTVCVIMIIKQSKSWASLLHG